MPVAIPSWTGRQAAATIQAFRATVPWRSSLHILNLLGSHDTSRIRTLAGDRDRQLAGLALLMTSPGIPCVFAGDELGLVGRGMDGARVPMPWDSSTWDTRTFEAYRRWIRLRHEHPALRHGGFRWVHIADDMLARLREDDTERLLVVVSRAPTPPVRVSRVALGAQHGEPLLDHDPLTVEVGHALIGGDGPAAYVWRL